MQACRSGGMERMAKYIIDVDAFRECLDLLPNPVKYGDETYTVYLDDVKELLNRFPKEEYGKEHTENIPVYRDGSATQIISVTPAKYDPFSSDEWSAPLYQCKKCHDGYMHRNNVMELTSCPPQTLYKCDKCGNEEYKQS